MRWLAKMSSNWNNGVFNQYRAAISGSVCYTIMGAATAWPSPTLRKMAAAETPLTLDSSQIGWMVSLMFLGHITSPVPSGYLMDVLGRKKTCLMLSVLPLTSWFLILFANTPTHLYIARFTAGLWIGVTTTIMPLYVGEISGPKLRNSLTTINNLLLNCGVLFVYAIGPYLSYYSLAIACEILTIIYIIVFTPMPESPHYFLKTGQKQKAIEALSWLRQDESRGSIEIEVNRIENSIEQQRRQKRGTFRNVLMDHGNRKALIISCTYAVLKRMSGSGVLQAYASITLPDVTLGFLNPDQCVIIIGLISLFSSLVSTALAIKFHRRILLTISCGGCAFASAVVMVWFYLNEFASTSVNQYSDVIFISLALYYLVFNFGLGPIGTSIKGEIFSANVRALSSSLTTIVVAITGFFMNKFYLIIAYDMGMYLNFFVFGTACVLAIIFTWTYMPDTQNKTLEEIQDILSKDQKPKNYSSTY